ncbi:diaminopimelate decarboxylase [Segatella oulorum F0390]|uniref:Diaminopimelate decarboxylase n=1 Tax=Segatella oulorum F0390 TaxID=702438 RepID=G1W9B0_9BACT|nr:diaminopimelate decarboxylase [Segatella oulorum]EGV34451.1 diaminopimelate decarboxylase [Segatella oulorum F0390]
MLIDQENILRFKEVHTPFYFYNTALLKETLQKIKKEISAHKNYIVHYAIKANANPKLLRLIAQAGFGADCVSGGEIERALDTGFLASKIVFAGVGKSDWEINLGLDNDIFCFNVESEPELEVINELAKAKGKIASVAFRINPNIGAHTHANITTGLAENKFGIAMKDMEHIIQKAEQLCHIRVLGLHFHIGSQILEMDDFIALCQRINQLIEQLRQAHHQVEHINVGGGLGIDYEHPDKHPIPNFSFYFNTYAKYLNLSDGQQLHFELGRAVVGQCGSLVTRVLYVKQGATKQFIIVDAGMTDLIRPALYQAQHQIENLNSREVLEKYDVVGPICESSDVFAKDILLPKTHRGDLIALHSAGAYGEIMASQYNCRALPQSYTSEELPDIKS